MSEKRFWLFLIMIVILGAGFMAYRYSQNKKSDLIIYTYSSFVSEWGPGPILKKKFEQKYHYTVQFVDAGDSALFIEKLKQDKAKKVDLVLGLDPWLLDKASQEISWNPIHMPKGIDIPEALKDVELKNFLPFDWAPMTFIYKKSKLPQPPKSLDDLLDKRFAHAIALEDPRTSTPGLQFLYWVALEKGNKTEDYLRQLKANVHSVSPSWSMAYGLFKKNQASLVFSYVTSPAYHWKNDKDIDYQAAAFRHPHPVQVEWLGVPASCNSCNVADLFIHFLFEKESQVDLMDNNYMFPMNMQLTEGTVFHDLPPVRTYSVEKYKPINLEELISTWKKIF